MKSDPPTVIGAFAAKTELSKLLWQSRAGRRFIITQGGKPVAELRPFEARDEGGKAKPGYMKGKIWIADDFCEPIDEMRDYTE